MSDAAEPTPTGDCPNIAANICAGPPTAGSPGCPGQSDIAYCRYRATLQGFEAQGEAQQEADGGFVLTTNSDDFTYYAPTHPGPGG